MSKQKQQYLYNPHFHVKIWFSNDPNVFLNDENQMRLIEMRYRNSEDSINLVYDSSLLETHTVADLHQFCGEYSIIPIDAAQLAALLKTDREKKLYEYYQDEINYLHHGGNLAVASDIIRWLSPVYSCGTYTDFDVPVDTSMLSDTVEVHSPLLMNIGSLKIRNKEVILSNNDYIAVVDPLAAQGDIEKIQDGFIKILNTYTNDFIEKTEKELVGDSLINRYLFGFLRNRSESIYIAKSKSIFPITKPISSRKLRGHINKIMSDEKRFIDFHRVSPTDTDESIIEKLREDLKKQLGLIKWLFFSQEYYEIKKMLSLPDRELVTVLMRKERSLYLKSIVVCTTGPLAIADALFQGHVFHSKYMREKIEPFSFNSYRLQRSFISKNSVGLHDNVLKMLCFLGASEGELNDSSWLEEGAKLQALRGVILEQRKKALSVNLPHVIKRLKAKMQLHVTTLLEGSNSFLTFFMREKRKEQINTLHTILSCFKETPEKEFDLMAFRKILRDDYFKKNQVFSGLLYKQTKALIHELERCIHEATILGLTKNHKIKLGDNMDEHIIFPYQNQLPVNTVEPISDLIL
ncbi:glycosyltransferase family 88 protein [Legionella fallonii]|uniref:Lgt1 glycosyltransferase domain-containing protein n=1 Tax=Legionella fallonii LLAP-10 TaxID=1212491 RepID=A0A098G7Z4_9GAMM|nr:glycosyltransferase family 88 protein [Legionella fallonii]CEG58573.1 conserved protein of unknown function [Legionella fallonii LLAP-10]